MLSFGITTGIILIPFTTYRGINFLLRLFFRTYISFLMRIRWLFLYLLNNFFLNRLVIKLLNLLWFRRFWIPRRWLLFLIRLIFNRLNLRRTLFFFLRFLRTLTVNLILKILAFLWIRTSIRMIKKIPFSTLMWTNFIWAIDIGRR